MKNNHILTLLYIIIGIALISCEPEEPVTGSSITIKDNIDSNTTWEGGKTYIIEKDNLFIGGKLEIEAGAIIKMLSEGNIILKQQGSIVCHGTKSAPIYFTSIKDDNHGGDSNNDGDNTIPAAGDWGYINLYGTQNSVFDYCCFLYGGKDYSNPATVDVSSEAKAIFNNCTFAYNSGNMLNNLYIGALNASNANKDTQITNCNFYGNKIPLTIYSEMNLDNSNTFSKEGLSNTYAGIFVNGDNVKRDISWLEDEVAFVITSADMIIERGKSLTIGNNVVLKFAEGSQMTILSGENYLKNHDANGVFFTSLKDDEHKGDTNGDGKQTEPNIADWRGIYLDNWRSTSHYATWSNILYNDPHQGAK